MFPSPGFNSFFKNLRHLFHLKHVRQFDLHFLTENLIVSKSIKMKEDMKFILLAALFLHQLFLDMKSNYLRKEIPSTLEILLTLLMRSKHQLLDKVSFLINLN